MGNTSTFTTPGNWPVLRRIVIGSILGDSGAVNGGGESLNGLEKILSLKILSFLTFLRTNIFFRPIWTFS